MSFDPKPALQEAIDIFMDALTKPSNQGSSYISVNVDRSVLVYWVNEFRNEQRKLRASEESLREARVDKDGACLMLIDKIDRIHALEEALRRIISAMSIYDARVIARQFLHPSVPKEHQHIPSRCPKCGDQKCLECGKPFTVGVMDFECSCPSVPKEKECVQVAGERMTRSLAEFNRAVEVLLAEEQEKPNANNTLIAVLCDAVRLSRENVRLATGNTVSMPIVPKEKEAQ